MRAVGIGLCMLLVSMLGATPSTAQTPGAYAEPSAEVQTVYREVVTRAVAEFDAQHFAEARALFLHAHALWPSARTLRTLGMTSFELGMYARALQELEAARDDHRRALPDDQRIRLLALIEQTRSYVGRYRITLSPPETTLSIDGNVHASSEVVLPIGEHVLLARAESYHDLRRVLSVQGREDSMLALSLEPMPVAKPTPPRSRALEYAAFGTGAAGLALSGVFTALTLQQKGELDSRLCPEQVCPAGRADDVERMKRFANVATVGLVIAAVGAAVGTFLWLKGRRERLELRASF